MKIMKFWSTFFMMVIATMFISCSTDLDDEEDWVCILPPDWGQPVFTLDADSVPHFNAFKPMSRADFEDKVAGYGWHCNALQKINNDGYISENILGQYYGMGPTHYYFGIDSLTKFIWVDHLGYVNGGMMYLNYEYTYDEDSAHIRVVAASHESFDELQLFSYFDTPEGKAFLYGIWLFGINSSGVPIYCVTTLQRMTSAELRGTRNLYSVNYADY